MTGNDFEEFMDDLYTCGGPEKQILFRGKEYFISSYSIGGSIEFYVHECFGKEDYIFLVRCKILKECINAFEVAKIFDGLNIYEAEKEIEVLFG